MKDLSGTPADLLLDAIRAAADIAGIGVAVTLVEPAGMSNLFLNQAAASLVGYTLEEAMQLSPWLGIAPEELPRMQEMHERRMRGEVVPQRFETLLIGKDGRRIPVEIATHRQEISGRQYNVTFLFDVSDRRAVERAVERAESRFASLVQSAPEGIIIIQEGRFVFTNPAAAGMLGYESPKALVGTFLASVLSPEEALRARERIQRLFIEGSLPDSAEYSVQRPDGTSAVVEIVSILSEYEGRPAVLSFARDVTERKSIQEQLLQADRLAAVGALSAGVAHEINNPLSYAMLNLEFLARELPNAKQDPSLLDQLIERLSDARDGTERVATIVRDLKTFARPSEGDIGPVDLTRAIDAAVKMAHNEIRHAAELKRHYGKVPAVEANAARLEQVFLNLLVNAVQALRGSGVSHPTIDVAVKLNESGDVLAEVSDNGPGIPAAVMDMIFLPFFTTKPAGIGTGLGLPICKSIIDSIGGKLSVHSVEGKGTTFTVQLRAHAGVPVERPSASVPESLGRPRSLRSLLVVDDEVAIATTLRILVRDHYAVTLSYSVKEALDEIDRHGAFDVILCDLMMPGGTGIDLFFEIKRKYPGLERRIVFMTGGAFGDEAELFMEEVENLTLEKPFQLAQLERALKQAASL